MKIKSIAEFVLRELIFDTILVIIFISFLMISMTIIKAYIDAQFPPVEQIINAEIGHIYQAEIFNVCVRKIVVKYSNGKIIMDVITNNLYYVLPFIISGITMLLLRPLLRKIKRVLRYIL